MGGWHGKGFRFRGTSSVHKPRAGTSQNVPENGHGEERVQFASGTRVVAAGRIGTVVRTDNLGNIIVKIGRKTSLFAPAALTKAPH